MLSQEKVTFILKVPEGLHFLGISCHTYAYSCLDLFPNINSSTIANVKIAAGVKPSSILVLRKKKDSVNYECIEIIDNISMDLLTRFGEIKI